MAAMSSAALACRSHASTNECRAMIEHYLDLAVRETPGAGALSPAQTTAVRDVKRDLKRAEPSYRKVQDHCEDIPRAEVSCALDAPSTTAWEACMHATEGGQW
jgi:hypothetical protein